MNDKKLCSMLCAGLLTAGALVFSPLAKADEWNKRTVITFHQPVEIPGMVLGPGTYVMKLVDSPWNRDTVQVFNRTETRVYDTVMTVPVYRERPADHTVFTFYERAVGSPQAIKDWYYPGDLRGQEFVYGKARTVAAPHPSTLQPRAHAAPPAPKPVEIAKAEPSPTPAAAPAPAAAPPAPAPAPQANPAAKQLPKTASDTPLLAMLGGCALTLGIVIRKVA